ncbi:MarR family winged helix-turn-helix transcriptional regulator [Bacillus sp. S/N-304-OC-R1]|uniref:MarR family winged helix-turn-helix transcriptional regulator n=1 Tax=Bacillus sp. S/N-304-OC-R1 TaxID=2758034 RepID=UPI001C8E1988|nr:MarR family transcriptional regulator [Bacillus sp. S/N-304-OC-R1]MBY0121412.1 MarR family transcriptional regulator [Bacillus sp. S/N-304-OC-R1]
MENQTIFELIHIMEKATNNMIIKWNQMFNENIGISHVLVLSHLKEHGKSRPSDIADRLGFAPPSITHLSEKLIKQKLAIRLRDEKDKRILYLDITDEGKKILKKAHEEGVTLRKQLFERLTEEERQQLLAIYIKLNEGW